MNTGRKTQVLLIEDDTASVRVAGWVLADEGFDVTVVSRREALELRSLDPPEVAVFNISASAADKTTYVGQLRMLNPECIIIDVDEFAGNGESVRDSGADSYTARPLQVARLIAIVRDLTARTREERQSLRDDREHELRPGSGATEPASEDPAP